jgi:ubiquitin C-terminal hydrolase
MLKCKVCEYEFTQEELFENHEIVVSNVVSLLANTFYTKKFHDAYNCPKCKHQKYY